jgi:hypothetical protein
MTQQPKRHKFDALVEKLQRENGGISKTNAMQLARQQYPDIYADYQGAFSSTTAQQQQSARSGANQYSKRAPVYLEDLISKEMSLGCNEIVAKQRLLHRYGSSLPKSAITKGADDLVDSLQQKVEDICDETGCSLTEGQRWVGKAYPNLLKSLR